jgi:hypothetical protein
MITRAEYWLLFVIGWGITVFTLWALIDCAIRKGPAFPAAGKLTKPTWLLMTGLSTLVSLLPGVGLLAIVATTVAAVYLADVRPAVREISGPSRW